MGEWGEGSGPSSGLGAQLPCGLWSTVQEGKSSELQGAGLTRLSHTQKSPVGGVSQTTVYLGLAVSGAEPVQGSFWSVVGA